MRALRAVVAAFILLTALCAVAQDENAYFTLNSNRTYQPGDKVSIDIWARHVDTLEFRVYRVNDPVKFFTQLKDLHQFGGEAPRPPHELTWLERFHNWKRGIFVWIRDFFRSQFTAENRHIIHEQRTAGNRAQQTQTQLFAQIPIINSQQLVAKWSQHLADANMYESASVPVPVKDRGVYLIEATDGRLRAYTVVIVSQIAIINKTAPGTMLAFVVDRASGTPIANADTYFYSSDQLIKQQPTSSTGISQVDVKDAHPERLLVMARTADDFAINTPWSYWMGDPAHSTSAYIYTDRPVYRPGDTVHFKAILRTRLGSVYQPPAGTDYNVDVHDSENKIVSQLTLKTSEMGTLHGEYAIPSNASLGDYSIVVRTSDQQWGQPTGTFAVEEYKKPEYEVRINTAEKRVLQGQPIHATIDARYYFGEPVAGAKVIWVVHTERVWNFDYYDADQDNEGGDEYGDEGSSNSPDYREQYYGGEQKEEQTGTLDSNGRLDITIPTEFDADRHNDVTYRIEARVTDQGNREISGHGYALATYGSYQISARLGSYVYELNSTAQVIVDAHDYDNNPVQTPFHVEVTQWDWRSRSGEPVYSTDGATDPKGHGEIKFPVTKGGELLVKVSAKTPEQRMLQEIAYIWVPENNEWYWGGGGRQQIQIIADQKSYKPGETAKLLIMAGPDPVHLLITTEGRGITSSQIVDSEGGPVEFKLPIKAENSPNFFVGVVFMKDNQLHQGTKNISVPPDFFKLNVQLQPSKPQFEPGETASYTITAKDADGKPAQAEFSVDVVDEAIYAIRPDSTTDILKFFYGTEYNRVQTTSSLNYQFQGEAGKKQMQLANVKPHKWLAQIKPERLVQPKIRKAFPDTAYWVADVRTDANGKATVKFNFPDALTAWRTTARGATADTKVGSAMDKVIVRKNLMVRIVVPRFFRQGDEVTVSAIVHNYLPNAKTARVSMDMKGLQVIGGKATDINVPSRGEVKVDWRVKALNVRESTVLAKALTDQESDAMELTLPVIPYGVKQSIPLSGSLNNALDSTTQEVDFPQRSESTSHSVQVDLTPSVSGAIFGALQYLTSYPYGCTEQTMSSFLPDIIVSQTIKELGLNPPIDKKDLDEKIDAGIKRLYTFQHDDGGWGWWQTDDSHVFMSAYVLAGLSQAKHAGYDVDQDRINHAQAWVRHTFDSDPKIIADMRAYMAYSLVLSGVTDKAVVDAVWNDRSNLTPYGSAMLGLAMYQLHDSRAEDLANTVEKGAKVDDAFARWELTRDPMLDFETDASPEATAFAAKFLSKVRPESPLLPKAAYWLVTHRDEGYWWDSTKQTAMVVYGLSDFLKQSGELNPSYTAEVLVNGKTVFTHTFTEKDAFASAPASVTLNADQLASANQIVIRKKGAGRLYWSVRGDYFSDEKRLTNVGHFSLTLAREYFKLAPVQEKDHIVYTLTPLSGPAQVGDTLAVRLTVGGSEWKYLMIEDPIPAGTEFIEKDNLYQLKDQPRWWGWWFTRREFHDDRANFFQTYFSRGSQEYFYLLKVVNPGVFRVSPGRVEPMYQPHLYATSDPQTMEVR